MSATKTNEYLFFRDIEGKDHSLKLSSYSGFNTHDGRYFVVFGKHEYEICKCEFRRVFLGKVLGNDYFTAKNNYDYAGNN